VIPTPADREAMARLKYACPPATQSAEYRSSPHQAANDWSGPNPTERGPDPVL